MLTTCTQDAAAIQASIPTCTRAQTHTTHIHTCAGFVDAVVLSAGSAKAADLAHANTLLAAAGGGVPVLRGSRPALIRAREDLLPPQVSLRYVHDGACNGGVSTCA